MLEADECNEFLKVDAGVIFNCRVRKGEVIITDEDLYNPNRKEVETRLLYEPLQYIIENYNISEPNQDLMKALNYWIKAPDDVFEKIEDALRYFPAIAVMTRDLEQGRKLRNGKPTAHVKFGVSRCINSIYFGQVIGWKSRFDHFKVKDVYTSGGVELCRVGHLQSIFIDAGICPTEEIHDLGIRKAVNSTLITEFDFLRTHYDTDRKDININNIVYYIKLFLSIIEECRRLTIEDTNHELFGEEVTYGYFTLPFIYAINNFPKEGTVILKMMRRHIKTPEFILYIHNLVKELGAFEYCKKKLQVIKKEISKEYEKLGPNPYLEGYINKYIVIPNDFKDVDCGIKDL